MKTDNYTTLEIAEYMLKQDKPYTSTELAKELNIPYQVVTGKFHNIRSCKKYNSIEIGTYPIRIKLLDIGGRSKREYLWKMLLQRSFCDVIIL